MGTWGPKSFENEALDWVSTVESADDLRKPLLQAIEELFAIHDSNPNFDFRRGSGDPQTNARKAQKLIETCLIMLAMNDHLGYCNKTRDQLLAELYARKGACAYWFNRYRTAMENYKTAIKLDAERESEWLSPFLIIAAKEFYNDEKYRESLEAFNYVIESGCSLTSIRYK